jgi:hypothetical protein
MIHCDYLRVSEDLLFKRKQITDRYLANNLISPTLTPLIRLINSYNGVSVLEYNSGNDTEDHGHISLVYSELGFDRVENIFKHSVLLMQSNPDISISIIMKRMPNTSEFVEFQTEVPEFVQTITLRWNSYEQLKDVYIKVFGFGDLTNFDSLVQKEQEFFFGEHYNLDLNQACKSFEEYCLKAAIRLKLADAVKTNEADPVKLLKYWSGVFNVELQKELHPVCKHTFRNYVFVETLNGTKLFSRSDDCFI